MAEFNDEASRYQFGQTRWSLVLHAGKDQDTGAGAARNELLVRYSEAVYRYLSAKLRDDNAAGEIFSRFAERVLEIHPFIQRANREKGRFRDYLKAILHRMVIDYYREGNKKGNKYVPLLAGTESEPAVDWVPPADEDAEFQKAWKDELLNQAWKSLARHEQEAGKPYYSLMLYKAQNTGARSEAMAQHFSKKLGRDLTADNVRKLLQRGQELLSELLVEEVARSLRETAGQQVTPAQIEEELINLGLFDAHRRKALERYKAAR